MKVNEEKVMLLWTDRTQIHLWSFYRLHRLMDNYDTLQPSVHIERTLHKPYLYVFVFVCLSRPQQESYATLEPTCSSHMMTTTTSSKTCTP